MKIVVLDSYTINSDPQYWEPLKVFGEVIVFKKTSADEVIPRSLEADIIILNKVRITSTIMQQLPKLKYIGLTGTGFDHVDTLAAQALNIVVTNAPGYGAISIAQHAFALLLQLTNHINPFNKTEGWVRDESFQYFSSPMVELYGKTLGILGWGATGKEMAKIATGFGMNVLVHSKHAEEVSTGKLTTIKDLFEKSDVLSIHVVLNDKTTGLVDAALIGSMKPSAFLINTSRGAVINEQDLADALNGGKIAGAGLDVLAVEPPPQDHPLLQARHCIVTPHISWITAEAQVRLRDIVMKNVQTFLEGVPINVV